MTGSPISDLNPIFMAANIKLNLCSLKHGSRTILMDHTFFVGYRCNVVLPEEVLVSIDIPFTKEVRILIKRNNSAKYISKLERLFFTLRFYSLFFVESIFYCL